jgi:hypothetical protein
MLKSLLLALADGIERGESGFSINNRLAKAGYADSFTPPHKWDGNENNKT